MRCKLKVIFGLLLSGAFCQAVYAQEKVGGNPQKSGQIVVPKGTASTADVSYFIGQDFGNGLTAQGFTEKDLDLKELIAGITDAITQKKNRLNESQTEAVMASLSALMQKKQAEMQKKMIELAKANLEKAKVFLEENKKKDGVQVTSTGLQYKVIKSGNGKQPSITDEVLVHYEGKTIEGVVFDSSLKKNEPVRFPVQRVVPGFSEALQRMKVGDKWIVTIPPELGYGQQGFQGIAPNETLIFELELLDVFK